MKLRPIQPERNRDLEKVTQIPSRSGATPQESSVDFGADRSATFERASQKTPASQTFSTSNVQALFRADKSTLSPKAQAAMEALLTSFAAFAELESSKDDPTA